MNLAYFDESGDDGYPLYSSPIFVLASVYLHESDWKISFEKIRKFRDELRKQFKLPIKIEFHTAEFICDKNPYHGLYSPETRREILFMWADFISKLPVKVILVAIDKKNIGRSNYDVLKNALKYNVQRIENDLTKRPEPERFMIITDEGRLSKMRSIVREIQRINYIPSQFGPESYRKDISCLIEDPLPKSSDQSYLIQIADFLAFTAHYYVKSQICQPPIAMGKRYMSVLKPADEIELMNSLLPVLNTKASRSNPYGVVVYPKK